MDTKGMLTRVFLGLPVLLLALGVLGLLVALGEWRGVTLDPWLRFALVAALGPPLLVALAVEGVLWVIHHWFVRRPVTASRRIVRLALVFLGLLALWVAYLVRLLSHIGPK